MARNTGLHCHVPTSLILRQESHRGYGSRPGVPKSPVVDPSNYHALRVTSSFRIGISGVSWRRSHTVHKSPWHFPSQFMAEPDVEADRGLEGADLLWGGGSPIICCGAAVLLNGLMKSVPREAQSTCCRVFPRGSGGHHLVRRRSATETHPSFALSTCFKQLPYL